MKIRRAAQQLDIRRLSIDQGDMFLMSQAEDLIEVSDLRDIAPWEPRETDLRLRRLVDLGLLEEWVADPRQPHARERSLRPSFDDAVTQRPKAPVRPADPFRQLGTSVLDLRSMDGLLLLGHESRDAQRPVAPISANRASQRVPHVKFEDEITARKQVSRLR